MKLAEFIEDSLVDIATGVRKANEKMRGAGAEGAPAQASGAFALMPRQMTTDNRSFIDFDVAVTATDRSGNTGGGGIQIAVLRAGIDATEERREERVTRIRFQVTIESEVA